MKKIIEQALTLKLWKPLDIQFSHMLVLSLSSEKKNIKKRH